MTGTSLDDLHRQWLDRPGYKDAYDALEQEFALASAMIEARARAGGGRQDPEAGSAAGVREGRTGEQGVLSVPRRPPHTRRAP